MDKFNSKFKEFLIGIVFTVILLALITGMLSKITKNKTANKQYDTFKKIASDVDVLFLGSSHVYMGVYPPELWRDYGITSYNLANTSFTIPMDYWTLKEALNYCHPRLVVLDVYMLGMDHYTFSDEVMHTLFDAFPLDATKIDAVFDMDTTAEGETDKLSILFPYSSYHVRWNELVQEDFEEHWNYERGCRRNTEINDRDFLQYMASTDEIAAIEVDTKCVEYLHKIIQLCQQNDIEILLTYIPMPTDSEALKVYDLCYRISEEYGITYLDIPRQLSTIDYVIDLSDFHSADVQIDNEKKEGTWNESSIYDNNGHLNTSGANKVTSFLGEYITNNYNIPDHRGDMNYRIWEIDYENWLSNNCSYLKNINQLDRYMMLLADNNYDVIVWSNGFSELCSDDLYRRLMNNLNMNDLNEESFVYLQNGKFIEDGDADLDFYNDEKGRIVVYHHDEWSMTLPEMTETKVIQFTVYKNEDTEAIDGIRYYFKLENNKVVVLKSERYR